MAKILGIDYGTKRIGLAISDETATLARELDILSPQQFWEEIARLVDSHEVQKIVLGLPIGMSGKNTLKTEEVKKFKDQLLKKINLPIEFMDERLSSTLAEQISGDSKNIDSLAAQIILQNYLDNQS